MPDIHDLIPVSLGSIGTEHSIPTVDGRHIHQWLAIRKAYATWVKTQIETLRFKENQHFIIFSLQGNNPSGTGRPSQEYHFTLDAAKHIAMVSRTQKGHELRDYFIAIEKRYQQGEQKAAMTAGDLLVQLAEGYRDQERRLQQTEVAAREAQANALRALETQCFYTVAEYVYINNLGHQLPSTAYRACSDHLRLYCQDHGIPFRKIGVGGKQWEQEYAFHAQVYTEAFPGWLMRRQGQVSLIKQPLS